MTKKRTMNELRQTKDAHYTNPSANKGWDIEGHKKYNEEIYSFFTAITSYIRVK